MRSWLRVDATIWPAILRIGWSGLGLLDRGHENVEIEFLVIDLEERLMVNG